MVERRARKRGRRIHGGGRIWRRPAHHRGGEARRRAATQRRVAIREIVPGAHESSSSLPLSSSPCRGSVGVGVSGALAALRAGSTTGRGRVNVADRSSTGERGGHVTEEAGGTRGRAFGRRECEARRRDVAVGLFVFPAQSRVTGAKYSYQWMVLGQQNGCHIMLDTGALGPKDMDSLGLSLFQPDFIITSFYWVFGSDPTGFGCLLIKKSVTGSLQGGMAAMPPEWSGLFSPPQYLTDSIDEFDAVETEGLEDDSCTPIDENPVPDVRNGS
ncbi:hypothetical protein ZWY2020_023844 [Hordeum vulgare]|nr:hypothetical protein ZWY2020_023844 [Hordeum vulgare]